MENASKQKASFNRWKEKFIAKKVDYYQEEIFERNYRSFVEFSRAGSLISICILIMGLLLSSISTFNLEFFMIFCYFIGLYFVGRFGIKKSKRSITPIFYLALTPLMIMGTMIGTYLDREVPSVTILVLLCVLTLFIIDKPWRIILYITVNAIFYVICCFDAKSYELFWVDMIDLFAFYFVAIGVNFFTLNDRIDSVENYIKYRDRSELDLMTGIYNREAGLNKIQHLIFNQVRGAFIIIDIDNFKEINDNFGHMYGDDVIKDISKIIKKTFQEDDIVLRMGGDEFVVYAIDIVTREANKKNLERLLRNIKTAKIGGEKGTPISISIGCSIYDRELVEFNRLYRDSDRCLYEAKSAGKGCYVISR
ncbi:GGDEF domain-containing protein [Anaerotignum sp.]|uniref:GGDEF domain-containing protein n=1 Tax=Anaerotignum sp. TaxID=2039241 RepID=UPI0028B09F67|nr:GGDEF domain-containing protein [Anaerotignum sp.]